MFRDKKGFTLIELLVVIAIIGILSSVVLASLNTARNRGADAAIKSNVNNARAQAELHYDTNSQVYSAVCTAADGIRQFVEGATNAGSTDVVCGHTADGWALSARLKTTNATDQFYCVDSSGYADTQAAGLTAGSAFSPAITGATVGSDITCI